MIDIYIYENDTALLSLFSQAIENFILIDELDIDPKESQMFSKDSCWQQHIYQPHLRGIHESWISSYRKYL